MSERARDMLKRVPDVLKPLLPEVWAALRETLGQAWTAAERSDARGMKAASHALKGAAMRFGLEELALIAARAEEAAASENMAWGSAALEEFSRLLGELEKTG